MDVMEGYRAKLGSLVWYMEVVEGSWAKSGVPYGCTWKSWKGSGQMHKTEALDPPMTSKYPRAPQHSHVPLRDGGVPAPETPAWPWTSPCCPPISLCIPNHHNLPFHVQVSFHVPHGGPYLLRDVPVPPQVPNVLSDSLSDVHVPLCAPHDGPEHLDDV
jgi:hypothetical protein